MGKVPQLKGQGTCPVPSHWFSLVLLNFWQSWWEHLRKIPIDSKIHLILVRKSIISTFRSQFLSISSIMIFPIPTLGNFFLPIPKGSAPILFLVCGSDAKVSAPQTKNFFYSTSAHIWKNYWIGKGVSTWSITKFFTIWYLLVKSAESAFTIHFFLNRFVKNRS